MQLPLVFTDSESEFIPLAVARDKIASLVGEMDVMKKAHLEIIDRITMTYDQVSDK
jgi:hypothetical protein